MSEEVNTNTTVEIVKTLISGNLTKNTVLAPDCVLGQMKDVWSNETGKEMCGHTVYEYNQWKKGDNRVIFIGGDHSITYTTYPQYKSARLVVIDAHLDMFSNERVFHGNWLRKLIEEGEINAEEIVVVGARSWDKRELEYAHEKRIRYVQDIPVFESKPTYLSIDVDGIDPAYAPGTYYMEPGGLSSRDVIEIVKKLRNQLVALDIVEIDPTRDINNMTSKLAAKLINEFL